MAATSALLPPITTLPKQQLSPFYPATKPRLADRWSKKRAVRTTCAVGLEDFIGGDLVKFDLGQWLSDVEEHKALAIYSPHEGGYEGRYLTRLRYQGYQFLDLSARGLGDPETTLTKIHPVCPAHVGKQPIARWYFPPEVDYRLSLLPPGAKGLVVWIIEAKVLSRAELQFLALLPSLRPNVRVVAECGNWRKFVWKPLKEIAGLPARFACPVHSAYLGSRESLNSPTTGSLPLPGVARMSKWQAGAKVDSNKDKNPH